MRSGNVLLLAVSPTGPARDHAAPGLRYAPAGLFLVRHRHQDCHAASDPDAGQLVLRSLIDGSTCSCLQLAATNSEGTERLASNPPAPAKFWITHKDPTNLGSASTNCMGASTSTGAFCTGSDTCTPTAHTLCYSGTPGLFTLSRGSGSSADNSTLQLTWTMSVDATSQYDVYQDSTKSSPMPRGWTPR